MDSHDQQLYENTVVVLPSDLSQSETNNFPLLGVNVCVCVCVCMCLCVCTCGYMHKNKHVYRDVKRHVCIQKKPTGYSINMFVHIMFRNKQYIKHHVTDF